MTVLFSAISYQQASLFHFSIFFSIFLMYLLPFMLKSTNHLLHLLMFLLTICPPTSFLLYYHFHNIPYLCSLIHIDLCSRVNPSIAFSIDLCVSFSLFSCCFVNFDFFCTHMSQLALYFHYTLCFKHIDKMLFIISLILLHDFNFIFICHFISFLSFSFNVITCLLKLSSISHAHTLNCFQFFIYFYNPFQNIVIEYYIYFNSIHFKPTFRFSLFGLFNISFISYNHSDIRCKCCQYIKMI